MDDGLQSYERLDSGPLGRGARFRQVLEVSGQRFTVELEVTEYDAPRAAASAFEIRGIDVVNRYSLRRPPPPPRSRRASRRRAAASRAGSSSR